MEFSCISYYREQFLDLIFVSFMLDHELIPLTSLELNHGIIALFGTLHLALASITQDWGNVIDYGLDLCIFELTSMYPKFFEVLKYNMTM